MTSQVHKPAAGSTSQAHKTANNGSLVNWQFLDLKALFYMQYGTTLFRKSVPLRLPITVNIVNLSLHVKQVFCHF